VKNRHHDDKLHPGVLAGFIVMSVVVGCCLLFGGYFAYMTYHKRWEEELYKPNDVYYFGEDGPYRGSTPAAIEDVNPNSSFVQEESQSPLSFPENESNKSDKTDAINIIEISGNYEVEEDSESGASSDWEEVAFGETYPSSNEEKANFGVGMRKPSRRSNAQLTVSNHETESYFI
jgi:hypothetical protein